MIMNIEVDENLLEHYPIETKEGFYVIAPYLIGQKIAFKLYHEWLEDESRDEEDNTINWDDAEWRIDEEIADIRGAVMSGIRDMLEQNNLYLI